MNWSKIISIFCVVVTILIGVIPLLYGNDFWFPAQASTVAAESDLIFMFITWLSVFFFVLICGLMFWYCHKYRRVGHPMPENQVTHNTPLELTWTIIPLILVIAIFYVGMEGYLDIRQVPADEKYEIRVTAQRWSWSFDHPNGASESGTLHVPVGVPVYISLRSQDVLHAFFIPAFRVKMDAVPGRITDLWFEATQEGEFDLYCAEYCGKDHSQMVARVVVMPDSDERLPDDTPVGFWAWVNDKAEEYKRIPDWELPEYAMVNLYPRCASCHLLEDKDVTGPSWVKTHGLWGKRRVFEDGSEATVDENYIRESLLEPQKKIVANFTGAMPTVKGQLDERQVYALVLMIKFLDRFDEEGNLVTPITEEDFYPSGTKPEGESEGGQESS